MVHNGRPQYWTNLCTNDRLGSGISKQWMYRVEYEIDLCKEHKQIVECRVPALERTVEQLTNDVQRLTGEIQQLRQQLLHPQMSAGAPALDNGRCKHGGKDYFVFDMYADNLMEYMKRPTGNSEDECGSLCQSLGTMFSMDDKTLYNALAKCDVSVMRQGKAHKAFFIRFACPHCRLATGQLSYDHNQHRMIDSEQWLRDVCAEILMDQNLVEPSRCPWKAGNKLADHNLTPLALEESQPPPPPGGYQKEYVDMLNAMPTE